MRALLSILMVVAAGQFVAWAAIKAFGASPGSRPIDEAELLSALRKDKFEGLPPSVLSNPEALGRRLEALVANPPGASDDERRMIRRRAVICLGMYVGAKAVPPLRKLAADPAEPFRRDAVLGLGRTKTKEGALAAAPFLKHEDELFREAAIDGLGASEQPVALEILTGFDAAKERPFIQRKRQEAIEKLKGVVNRPQPKQ